MWINCTNCQEAIEVPDELVGDTPADEIHFICEACQPDEQIEDEDYLEYDPADEDDGEPDFTLDEWEWAERYPELAEDELFEDDQE